QREDEDLAVADLALGAGSTGLDDRVDGRLDEIFVHRDLKLHLPEQIHRELVTAVDLGKALLAPKALNVGDRQAEDLHLGKRFLDGLQLRGLNDRNDQLHKREPALVFPSWRSSTRARERARPSRENPGCIKLTRNPARRQPTRRERG